MFNKGVLFPPHYLPCTLMNLKHVWTRLMGILRVYLAQYLPFSFYVTMLFYSLNHEHASKKS